jgi:hypothetical protein
VSSRAAPGGYVSQRDVLEKFEDRVGYSPTDKAEFREGDPRPRHMEALIQGLREAGSKIGARYPVTFYQNFQPEFPKPHKAVGAALGIE